MKKVQQFAMEKHINGEVLNILRLVFIEIHYKAHKVVIVWLR